MKANSNLALVFPGQGSQHVGMGKDFYDNYASSRAVFQQAEGRLDFSLSRLCFEGPEEKLKETANAQPAIVAVSLAVLEGLKESGFLEKLSAPAFTAGHSLGEYAALAASGALNISDAIYLARRRGELMAQAAQSNPGAMAAIIGLEEKELCDICSTTGAGIANYNCPGQLVISGSEQSIDEAIRLATEKGARRAVPLAVSGAFHTPLMRSAAVGLAGVIEELSFKNPVVPIVGNTTACPLSSATEIIKELIDQLTGSVRWQESVEYMIGKGITTFLEIGPGKVLSGLIKRINRDVTLYNVEDSQTLTALENKLG
ncbi:MAG: ACP S-malonyltransferase [Chloroflexi bacterium]|nr:ACP S-malonyltransferase [Chloroflexota bacterium]